MIWELSQHDKLISCIHVHVYMICNIQVVYAVHNLTHILKVT